MIGQLIDTWMSSRMKQTFSLKLFFPLRGMVCNGDYSGNLHMRTNLIENMHVGVRIILVHGLDGKEKIVEKRGGN